MGDASSFKSRRLFQMELLRELPAGSEAGVKKGEAR